MSIATLCTETVLDLSDFSRGKLFPRPLQATFLQSLTLVHNSSEPRRSLLKFIHLLCWPAVTYGSPVALSHPQSLLKGSGGGGGGEEGIITTLCIFD